MASQPVPYLSPEEYLAIERAAVERSEYYRGQMYAMSGASVPHNVVTMNLGAEALAALAGRGCSVVSSDLRVSVPSTGLFTYPDVIIFCGEPQLADSHFDTLLNPVAIFEVLSPSTESYDRGPKFAMYQAIESLRTYALVSQTSARIEWYTRQSGGKWIYEVAEGREAVVQLTFPECSLRLDRIYARVAFPEASPLR